MTMATKPAAKAAAKAAPKGAKAAPSAAPSQAGSAKKRHGFRRKLIGTVTSDKMDKTVVVEVVRQLLHNKYKKYVTARKRFKAHDEKNEYKIGDKVEIQEHRPISHHKRWTVTRLLVKAAEQIEIADVPAELLGAPAPEEGR
jgi:small subunit ribosomal protein S17